ncbi:hypothetical protein [Nocardia terpenica]|uniref:hypothetical protein n=1 Tax=Nocardia terpenica TaxID=455432 RepID=UPI000AF95A42|nr:hypothetical protein [Nocardia terpenica]NQE91186.1 hypothetical protein [Nocardia terpenica]
MPIEPKITNRATDLEYFVKDAICRATRAGIFGPDSHGRTALENYVVLGYGVADPHFSEAHPPVPNWREFAILMTRFPLVVGIGDYEVYDAVLDAEDETAECARVIAATQYFKDCLCNPDIPQVVPDLAGREMVAAMGREYQDIVRCHGLRAHPEALDDWRKNLIALLEGMERYRCRPRRTFPVEIVNSIAIGSTDIPAAMRSITQRYEYTMPGAVARYLPKLMASPDPDDRDRLLLLLRTAEEGCTIGAGPWLKCLQLHAPPQEVTATRLRLLHEVACLSCYRTRIGNDLSDFTTIKSDTPRDTFTGERIWHYVLSDSAGPNVTPHDLPPDTVGHVMQCCLQTEEWLGRALADSLRELWRSWPWAGAAAARLSHAGHRPYDDLWHYDFLSRSQFLEILNEFDRTFEIPFLARSHPEWDGKISDTGNSTSVLRAAAFRTTRKEG